MKDLGERYEIDGTSFRPYFGCSSTIAASGAAANILRRTTVNPDDIAQIVVRCHPLVANDNADNDPHTLLAARLSLPFNVALVLTHGDVLAADLQAQELANPGIRALLPRIKLVSDPSMLRRACHLELRFKDGRRETEAIDVPRGSAGNPLTWEDVVAKFKPLVRGSIAGEDQIRVIDAVANIEAMDGAAFMRVMATALERAEQDAGDAQSGGCRSRVTAVSG